MSDILTKLAKPFHPAHITWKPGVFNRDKTKALALAYADLRAYQNRLDEVCGLGWSVSYTPWGERIVCHLTINGVTRSSTGEPDAQSERSEFAGTAAEAQAMKRAAAQFGLGRYLYSLPTVWAEYDQERKQFTEQAKARLNGIVIEHYRRHVDPDMEVEDMYRLQTDATDAPEPEPSEVRQQLLAEFNQLGQELYGDQWPQVRRHNVERISGGASSQPEALSAEQLAKLIVGLKKLKRQRQAA